MALMLDSLTKQSLAGNIAGLLGLFLPETVLVLAFGFLLTIFIESPAAVTDLRGDAKLSGICVISSETLVPSVFII